MVSTLFYVVFFAVGPGSIPWMITAELFSQVDNYYDDLFNVDLFLIILLVTMIIIRIVVIMMILSENVQKIQ